MFIGLTFHRALIALLVAGCCICLPGPSLRAQSLHDIIASLDDRHQVLGQREQVRVFLGNQTNPPDAPDSPMPAASPIDWTGVGTDPGNAAVDSLGLAGKIALLNQAVAEFDRMKGEFLNASAAEFGENSTVGNLCAYEPYDFDPLPRATPDNFHRVLGLLGQNIRSLRLLRWTAAYKHRGWDKTIHVREVVDYNDPEDEDNNDNREPYIRLEPEGVNPATVVWLPSSIAMDEPGMSESSHTLLEQWPGNSSRALVLHSGRYSERESGEAGIPALRDITTRMAFFGPEFARISATAQGADGTQIGGTVFILRRNDWHGMTADTSLDRNQAGYVVAGCGSTGTIALFDTPPGVTIHGSWVTGFEGENSLRKTFVPGGYQHLGAFYSPPPGDSDNHFKSYERNWNIGCTFHSVFQPAFARGVDAPEHLVKWGKADALLAGNHADGEFLVLPRPGLLFGIRLGPGLRGAGRGLISCGSPKDTRSIHMADYEFDWWDEFYFPAVGSWHAGVDHCFSPQGASRNPMFRFDSSYSLQLAGTCSDYHVVWDNHRTARTQSLPDDGLGWPFFDSNRAGWFHDYWSLYAAWDSPRLRQVAGRDLIADVEHDTRHHGGYTIRIYRRPDDAPAPTPGQAIDTGGLPLVRTWSFSNPDAGAAAHPAAKEKLVAVGNHGEKHEILANHDLPGWAHLGGSAAFHGAHDDPREYRPDDSGGDGTCSWTVRSLQGVTEKRRVEIAFTTTQDEQTGRARTAVRVTEALDGLEISSLSSDTHDPFGNHFPADWEINAAGKTIVGTAVLGEWNNPGSGYGKWPVSVAIDYGGTQPDANHTWDANGLLASSARGPWSTTGTMDAGAHKLVHKHNGSRYASDWVELPAGGNKIKFYSAPDATATGRDHASVAWTEIEYNDLTKDFPGLPAMVKNSDGTGAIFDYSSTGNAPHGFSISVDSGFPTNGAVTFGTRTVSATNARGYPVSNESFAILAGVTLQTGGTEYSDFTGWGAPQMATDSTTGQETTWAYQGNLGRLASITNALGLSTTINGYDALGRLTSSTTGGITAAHTYAGFTTSTAFSGEMTGSQSTTTDGLGRLTTASSTWNGATSGLTLNHGAANTTATTSHSLIGNHTSVLRADDGSLATAGGSTMPFGGTTGDALEVDGDLLKSRVETTDRPGIFRTTWTDAWGRVRKIAEPGANGGTDETNVTYSPPASPVQRVLVNDAAGRRSLSEFELATGVGREGIDVNGDGELGAGDRFTATTPTIDGGEVKLATTTTGESTPLAEARLNPSTGASTAKSAGGAANLSTTTNWTTKTSTTTSTDGWSSTTSFNNLGLATTSTTTGTGIPAATNTRTLRADGSVEATTTTIGGETSSAEFAANGLLTAYTDPVLGSRSVSHDITNGAETLTVGGQSSTTSLDGTISAISGPNIFAREVSTEINGGALQTTIDPTGDGASTPLTLNDAGLKTEHGYAAGFKPAITWKPGGLPDTINTGLGNIVFNHSANGARDLLSITFPTFGPNAGSGAIGFTYDDAGRIQTLTDDTGTRTYIWSFGHPLSETWDTGPAIERPLDAKRRLAGTTVKEGNNTLFATTPAYTGPSRELNSISIDPDGVGGPGFSATFTRDPATRRITAITRGGVTQTFGRGTGGRITSATSNVSGAPSFSYPENTHDGQGRRTVANTNRGNWSYEYRGGVNGDGQLQTASHSGNWDFEYQHDGIGRRTSFKPPGTGQTLQTGNANQPLNQFLSTQWTQQRILRARLDREAAVEITRTHALPTLLPGLPADPLLPLRDIVFPLTAPGTQGGWTAWSITGTLEGGGDPGAAPDRKAKLAGLAWFPPAQETFTYDAAGNRSSSARWLYTYDGLNRLTRAVNKSLLENDPNNNEGHEPEAWDVEFTYDAEGRRHSKTSKRYSNGSLKGETHTTWIWDGWHPVVERIVDPASGKTITERKLVWGPDLSGQIGGAGLPAIATATAGGAGGLLLIRETNHSFDGRPPVTTDLLPLYDGSGNIVGLANPAGDLLAEYWYGPFGELLEATGPKAETNPWRWATKSLDKETGLVYFGLRYYDPATGQWLSREPLGEGESLNLYAYCHNDPINRVDVLGAAETGNQSNWLSEFIQCLFPANLGPHIQDPVRQQQVAYTYQIRQTVTIPALQFPANGVRAFGLAAGKSSRERGAELINSGNPAMGYALGIAGGSVEEIFMMGSAYVDPIGTGSAAVNFFVEQPEQIFEESSGPWDAGWKIGRHYATSWNVEKMYSGFANGNFAEGFMGMANTTGTLALIAPKVPLKMGSGNWLSPKGRFEFLPLTIDEGVRYSGLPPLNRMVVVRAPVTIDVTAIRFSQSNVRRTLPEITASMKAHGWQGAPIDVVRMADGTLIAVDNTRLAAASVSNTKVQAIIRGFDELFPASRAAGNLQGATWGEAVLNRIRGQRPGWQRLYPSGAPFTGVHPSTPSFSP